MILQCSLVLAVLGALLVLLLVMDYIAGAVLKHYTSTIRLDTPEVFDWERNAPELYPHNNVVSIQRMRRHKKVVGQ